MILLAGIPTEGPFARVRAALEEIGIEPLCFDQRDHRRLEMRIVVEGDAGGGAVSGVIQIDGCAVQLEAIRGVYLRTMDDLALPDIATGACDAGAARSCRQLHDMLASWADLAPTRVLNRPSDMASNRSKPFQAHVIRSAGFKVPETLITNDPESAREFIQRQWDLGAKVIYKSISSVRSIVECVKNEDLRRLNHIRWCPTQFQACVEGTDIRVHTVGERTFAVEIESEATDYRYASRQTGHSAALSYVDLEASVARRCAALAARLSLPLAGVDLRRTREGEFYCFEVNPSPAFSYYEDATGAPISSAIARYLAGESA